MFTTIGPEQEYFLIDERYYFERPDLVTTGRTLFGAKPPKGHELDDHYFGSIPERVLACMLEAEQEMAQARHPDQDAPQRGRAGPVRVRAGVRELQRRLGPPAALHADPAERRAPLRPRLPAAREAVRGRQRLGQAQQLVVRAPTRASTCSSRATRRTRTCSSCSSARAVLAAVDKHQELLRASIASPGQDHRLGANEAPPAIISIFLGAELQKVYDAIESGSGDAATPSSYLKLGASVLPHLPMHGGDRNRTSPFAFTGNKFEFRALGSSMSLRPPEHGAQHDRRAGRSTSCRTRWRPSSRAGPRSPRRCSPSSRTPTPATSGSSSTATTTRTSGTPRRRRAGSRTCAQTPDALPALISESAIEVMGAYDVLSERELESRYEVFVEQYVAKLNIEAETTFSMAKTLLLPAAVRYLGELGLAGESAGVATIAHGGHRARRQFVVRIGELETANANHPEVEDVLEHGQVRPAHRRAGDGRRSARSPTSSSGSSRTRSGRCRSTRRSSSSSSAPTRAFVGRFPTRGDRSFSSRGARALATRSSRPAYLGPPSSGCVSTAASARRVAGGPLQ